MGFPFRMLEFPSFEYKSTLGRNKLIAFIMYVLSLFKKDWTNVVCSLGDSHNKNTSIATSEKLPLLGWASH